MTDALIERLEPCPFCGSPGYVYDDPHGPGKPTTWVAVCEADCDAAVYFDRPTKAEAITAWNTRHPSRNDVLEEAARERDELQELFDLQYKADMRAVKRWQAANPGNDLTWPDRADFGFWLMNKVEEMLAALEPFADQADDIERFVEDAAKNGTSPIMATKKFRLADFKKAQSIVRALKDRDG